MDTAGAGAGAGAAPRLPAATGTGAAAGAASTPFCRAGGTGCVEREASGVSDGVAGAGEAGGTGGAALAGAGVATGAGDAAGTDEGARAAAPEGVAEGTAGAGSGLVKGTTTAGLIREAGTQPGGQIASGCASGFAAAGMAGRLAVGLALVFDAALPRFPAPDRVWLAEAVRVGAAVEATVAPLPQFSKACPRTA